MAAERESPVTVTEPDLGPVDELAKPAHHEPHVADEPASEEEEQENEVAQEIEKQESSASDPSMVSSLETSQVHLKFF